MSAGPPSLVPSWRERENAPEFFGWQLGLNGKLHSIGYEDEILWYLARQVVWHINEARRAVYCVRRPRNSLLYAVESVAAAKAILEMVLDLRRASVLEADEAYLVLDELIVEANHG